MNDGSENDTQKPDYKESKFLRREAGEGWHPDGLNTRLLGAIIAREALIDAVVANERPSEMEELEFERQSQEEMVERLKKEYGVGQPPVDIPPEAGK